MDNGHEGTGKHTANWMMGDRSDRTGDMGGKKRGKKAAYVVTYTLRPRICRIRWRSSFVLSCTCFAHFSSICSAGGGCGGFVDG